MGLNESNLEGVEVLHSLLVENEGGSNNGPFTDLRLKSRAMPPQEEYSPLDAFLDIVTRELEDLDDQCHDAFSNLTSEEKKA